MKASLVVHQWLVSDFVTILVAYLRCYPDSSLPLFHLVVILGPKLSLLLMLAIQPFEPLVLASNVLLLHFSSPAPSVLGDVPIPFTLPAF